MFLEKIERKIQLLSFQFSTEKPSSNERYSLFDAKTAFDHQKIHKLMSSAGQLASPPRRPRPAGWLAGWSVIII